jgi:hypothetical protein
MKKKRWRAGAWPPTLDLPQEQEVGPSGKRHEAVAAAAAVEEGNITHSS